MTRKIGFIAIAYFAIGGLVILTQFGLSKVLEPPPCDGIPLYAISASFVRSPDFEEPQETGTEKPESLARYSFRFGRGLARWLPDLVRQGIVMLNT